MSGRRWIDGMRRHKRGNALLRDGDTTWDECPRCLSLLRVRRGRTGPIMLWCPCGYEISATDATEVRR